MNCRGIETISAVKQKRENNRARRRGDGRDGKYSVGVSGWRRFRADGVALTISGGGTAKVALGAPRRVRAQP